MHFLHFFNILDCPDGENYVKVEGKCFYMDTNAKTIEDAYSSCSAMSAKLWEPHTLEVFNQVHAYARTVSTDKVWWVGISDANSEGNWYYKSTGTVIHPPVVNHGILLIVGQ